MKKIICFLVLPLFWACTKKEVVVPKKLDLNGTFIGKAAFVVGVATTGTATWVISHQENEFTADITYTNVNGFGLSKFKGTVVNDSTFVGNFVIVSGQIALNGKISKDGNRIVCTQPIFNPEVSVSFDLLRK